MSALPSLDHHRLTLSLRPLPTGELFLVGRLRAPVYVWNDGMFTVAMPAGQAPGRDDVMELVRQGVKEVFLEEEDLLRVQTNLDQALVRVTRSLSVGDPRQNGSRALKLMALNLGGLYRDPHDDGLLTKQFQSTQNMGKFLLENRKLQPVFFQDLGKEHFHFTVMQPMLSSILLLGFLQTTHLFHEREIETLFLTSYLKDIGIGLIPEDKYEIKGLTHDEQHMFARHADFSHDILDGRVPLTKHQLDIIRHHHFLNDRLKKILHPGQEDDGDPMAYGLESTLVAVADILIAMTSARPYRPPMTLFQSLELVRKMVADEYPQEFRALVGYLRQFFRA